MKQLILIVCGHGALAKALLDYGNKISTEDITRDITVHMCSFDDLPPSAWIPPYKENTFPVAIHAGKSGNQLSNLITFCEQRGIPIIQAATGMTLPQELKIPVINAPNMAIEIIAFLKHLPAFIDGITKQTGVEVEYARLTESHQETKGTSVPGTARRIGAIIGVPDDKIVSIRKPSEQSLHIGVPEEHLARHAYHTAEIKFKGGTRIGLTTKIHGLETYAKGAVFLAQRAFELNLSRGIHEMTELI